jgi:hypothetical protein
LKTTNLQMLFIGQPRLGWWITKKHWHDWENYLEARNQTEDKPIGKKEKKPVTTCFLCWNSYMSFKGWTMIT